MTRLAVATADATEAEIRAFESLQFRQTHSSDLSIPKSASLWNFCSRGLFRLVPTQTMATYSGGL